MTASQYPIPKQIKVFPESTSHKIDFIESISSISEFKGKGGFFRKLTNLILGPPTQQPEMLRPISVTSDGQDLIIVTDLGLPGVHIFSTRKKKHKLLKGGPGSDFRSPVDVVFCGKDRFCVSDSVLGKIFVFDLKGKFKGYLGDAGGEGFFRRPTGLAYDPTARRLYVTDTSRHKIYALDETGAVVKDWGERGRAEGQFNYPTDLTILDDFIYVIDSLNFRVQVFNLEGEFRFCFGRSGKGFGFFARPKSISPDPDLNWIYITDGMTDLVQVFSKEGEPLFAFGGEGTSEGCFQLASGISADHNSGIVVTDSMNRRIQFFKHKQSKLLSETGAE